MAKKHDPFFVHLWDELTSAKLLQETGFRKWIDVPAKLQSQFVAAARQAMQSALGVPGERKRKAAKTAPKAKPKPKTKPKTKPKAKAKPKAKRPGAKAPAAVAGNG